ncbi:hypothetical protein LTR22_027789, partial [Elasticomyces elasticus]
MGKHATRGSLIAETDGHRKVTEGVTAYARPGGRTSNWLFAVDRTLLYMYVLGFKFCTETPVTPALRAR